ncbi:MAG: helix-turn-helix domain-containing protein [Nonlabens sp.]
MKHSIVQIQDITLDELQSAITRNILKALPAIPDRELKEADKLLTREQTAELLSISLGTLWSWTRKGILVSYRIGNKIMYKQTEVYASLEQINHTKS